MTWQTWGSNGFVIYISPWQHFFQIQTACFFRVTCTAIATVSTVSVDFCEREPGWVKWVHPGGPSWFIMVGGWPTPLKNMKVNGKDDIPYIMENTKCLKPPASLSWFILWNGQTMPNTNIEINIHWSMNINIHEPKATEKTWVSKPTKNHHLVPSGNLLHSYW